MGSGLLFGGIGVLWITVLSRTWLNRRSLARADRAAPPSSRQRILDPGAKSGRGRRDGAPRPSRVSGGLAAATANRSVVAVQTGVRRPSRAARRRRRVLLALVLVTGVSAAAVVVHRAPWWSAVAAAGVAVAWFVLATVAARAGRRARRGYRRRERIREQAGATRDAGATRSAGFARQAEPGPLPADTGAPIGTDGEPPWACVPRVGVVARWGREECPTDGLDRRQLVASTAGVVPDRLPAGVAVTSTSPDGPSGLDSGHRENPVGLVDGSWQPVPVPLPTYVTAPRAPRTVASIDLGCPGAWTSAAGVVGAETAQILLGWGVAPEARPQTAAPRPQVQVQGLDGPRAVVEPAAARDPDVGSAAGSPQATSAPELTAGDLAGRHAAAGTEGRDEDELTSEVTYELPRAVGT